MSTSCVSHAAREVDFRQVVIGSTKKNIVELIVENPCLTLYYGVIQIICDTTGGGVATVSVQKLHVTSLLGDQCQQMSHGAWGNGAKSLMYSLNGPTNYWLKGTTSVSRKE